MNNSEPLWKLTHESKCGMKFNNSSVCICVPEKRIPLIRHILAACTIDAPIRELLLQEIQKCTTSK
jgi:hypothetical protein